MLFQIALVVFAIYAIARAWNQYRARHVSRYWFVMFCMFWFSVAVVAIVPDVTNIVANFVGVGRGADLSLYISVVALFYVVYRLLLGQQALSDELTELVRHLAMQQPAQPEPGATTGAARMREQTKV